MRQDADRRIRIERLEAQEDNCGIEEDTGQISAGIEILLPFVQQHLDNYRGVYTMKNRRLKSEIAQFEQKPVSVLHLDKYRLFGGDIAWLEARNRR